MANCIMLFSYYLVRVKLNLKTQVMNDDDRSVICNTKK